MHSPGGRSLRAIALLIASAHACIGALAGVMAADVPGDFEEVSVIISGTNPLGAFACLVCLDREPPVELLNDALRGAAKAGFYDLCRQLIEAGADVCSRVINFSIEECRIPIPCCITHRWRQDSGSGCFRKVVDLLTAASPRVDFGNTFERLLYSRAPARALVLLGHTPVKERLHEKVAEIISPAFVAACDPARAARIAAEVPLLAGVIAAWQQRARAAAATIRRAATHALYKPGGPGYAQAEARFKAALAERAHAESSPR